MTEDKVAVAKRAYDAFNRGDIDALVAVVDPEIEWHEAAILFDRGVYRGHDGLRKLIAENAELWDELRMELDEVFDAGGEQGVAIGRFVGKIGGIDVSIRFVHVATFRDGKIAYLQEYEDAGRVGEALRAGGRLSD